MEFSCITNNKGFYDKYWQEINISYHDCTLREIMVKTRDLVHGGYKILTHPLSGSIKPNETPFKTIFLEKGTELHTDSLMLIENCIITCDKFTPLEIGKFEDARQDFETIDLTLAESALYSIRSF